MSALTIENVIDLLIENEAVAARTLSMVPSENSMSALAKLPLMLDVYHRYFFNRSGDPDRWGFRGSELTGRLETDMTDAILAELGKASHVNTRPLSGLNAMTLVLAALGGPPGSAIITVPPANGGHYATKPIAELMGLRVEHLPSSDVHTIDYAAIPAIIAASQPALIYVDQSNCLFPLDVTRLAAARTQASPQTLIHVDASHWMGLVLGGALPNPLDCGADTFGGSTHKTFPGPQKGVFMTRRPDLADRVLATEDYLISSHHFAATLSLGLALLEFRDFGGTQYAHDVVANTRRFAECVQGAGLPVEAAEAGFSAGHQLWLDTERVGLSARSCSDRLAQAGLRVNVQPSLPGIPRPAVRVGLNEATFYGLGPAEMAELADIFVAAALDRGSRELLAGRVAGLRASTRRRYGCTPQMRGALTAKCLRLWESLLADRAPDRGLWRVRWQCARSSG